MKHKAHDLVLGVSVTPRTVFGVLLQQGEDGPTVVRRYSRTRAGHGAPAAPSFSSAYENHDGGTTSDAEFTLVVGDGPSNLGGGDLFLASEFGGSAPGSSKSGFGMPAQGPAVVPTELFTEELMELLAECREGFGAEPVVSLVAGTQEVWVREVRLPRVEKERLEKQRARFLAALKEQIVDFDEERAVFLPMTLAEEDQVRMLAVAPRQNDSVTATLRDLRQIQRGVPPARLVDSEVTLCSGLARLATTTVIESGDGATFVPPPTTGSTLVVRAGNEDTRALFLRDGTIQHHEHLLGLTAYDAAETLCSRLLLLQDEHAIGEVGRILVLSESNEADLVERLGVFFPDSYVSSLRNSFPGELGAEAQRSAEIGMVTALAAALRLGGDARTQDSFPEINLLPKGLRRRQVAVPYTWHVYALSLVLFLTAFFFVARFFVLQSAIQTEHERLTAVAPEKAEMNVRLLQTRIDSLQAVTARYNRSLQVIDTLLLGSDRWSRALEEVSREASVVRGLWVESWKHEDGKIVLAGNVTSRDRIVAFAERTGGDIALLSFSEIREFPVYNYTLNIPLTNELPDAALYLREHASTGPAPANN